MYVLVKQKKCRESGCSMIVRVQDRMQRKRCHTCEATYLAGKNDLNATTRAEQAAAAVALLTQMSTEERKEEPPEAEFSHASHETRQPLIPLLSPTTPAPSYSSHRRVFFSPTEYANSLCHRWLMTLPHLEWSREIRGGIQEYRFLHQGEEYPYFLKQPKWVELLRESAAYAHSLLRKAVTNLPPVRLISSSLMQSPFGVGDQPVHMDIAEREAAQQSWSVIVYVVDTVSTAFPRHPWSEIEPLLYKDDVPLKSLKLISRDSLVSEQVEAGTGVVFSSALDDHSCLLIRDALRCR
jgi:hypothetical protein